MSKKHPIIAVTGSSGAGTSTVKRTFDNIFRREGITAAVIEGGTTNKAFLLDLLGRPQVRTGEVDTGWLDRLMAEGYRPPRRLDVALLAVAVEAQDEHAARQREQLFASAERGRPEVGHETWHQIDVRAGGEAYRLRGRARRGEELAPMKLFHLSNMYLCTLFIAIAVDAAVGLPVLGLPTF